MTYDIRSLHREDAADLCELLNHIIRLGGSTAYEAEFSSKDFLEEFHEDPGVLGTLVAEHDGELCGFQTLHIVDATRLAIASFADQRVRRPGVGRALFKESEKVAARYGAKTITAKIRADNIFGLRFYRGRGFKDVDVLKAVPLRDGTPVDRIVTVFDMKSA